MDNNGYLQVDLTQAAQGWQCPACKLIYAPHIKSCDCSVKKKAIYNLPIWQKVTTAGGPLTIDMSPSTGDAEYGHAGYVNGDRTNG